MLVDLHIHSYYSDGTMTPEEIVIDAKKKGIGIISVTDHDNIEAYREVKAEAEKQGIIAIRGVEIDSIFQGHLVHLLAYGFEEADKLVKLINYAKELLLETSVQLIKQMENKYENISSEGYSKYEYDRKKGGWKGIHYLFDRGITTELFGGMKLYGQYGCAHHNFEFPTVEEVCNVVHEAGGVVVLAHPSNYYSNKSSKEIEDKLEILRSMGIDGVECYYPAHDELMTNTCTEFCKKNNMIITAGSDGHGAFAAVSKGIEYYIGAVKIKSDELTLGKLIK